MRHFKTLFSDTFDSGFYLIELQDKEGGPQRVPTSPEPPRSIHSFPGWPQSIPHHLGNSFLHARPPGQPAGGKDSSLLRAHCTDSPCPLSSRKEFWENDARTWTKDKDFGVRKAQVDSRLTISIPDLTSGDRRWDLEDGGRGWVCASRNVA